LVFNSEDEKYIYTRCSIRVDFKKTKTARYSAQPSQTKDLDKRLVFTI